MSQLQASVIIPSLRSPLIARVVARLLAQSACDRLGEILVVGLDDERLVPQDAKVRFISTRVPVSAGAARNVGIRAARHDLLIFLDSDCLPEPNWLAHHLCAHESGHSVVIGGIVPAGTNYWSLVYNLTMFHEFFSTHENGPRRYAPTLNLSVRRELIERAGLMRADLERCEDIEWTTRLRRSGGVPHLAPAAAVTHLHERVSAVSVHKACAHSGAYSTAVRAHNRDLLEYPVILRNRALTLLFAPVLAAAATARMVASSPEVFARNWQTAPMLYATKLAWCWGAAARRAVAV